MIRATARALFVVLLVGAAACHGASAPATPAPMTSPLVGSWRFVTGTYTQPDGSASTTDSTQVQAQKVIVGTHFAYVTMSGNRFVRAAAGTYRSDTKSYTEHIELTAVPEMLGNDYTFTYRLEGDAWYLDGNVGGTRLQEIYRRVR